MKALDEAYKSGVFTKEEYDAKKQALIGTPVPAPPPPPVATPAPAATTEPAATPPVAPAAIVTPAPTSPAVPKQEAPPPPVPRHRAAQPATQAPPAPSAPTRAIPEPTPLPAAPAPPLPAEPEPAPLAGCQDAESRAGGPNGAQQRFFAASEDAVRRAALQALARLDFVVHNSSGHQIEASKKGKLNAVVGAGSERVILRLSSTHQNGQAGTRVVGETKRGFVGRVTQKSWTSAVLAQISCNLRVGG